MRLAAPIMLVLLLLAAGCFGPAQPQQGAPSEEPTADTEEPDGSPTPGASSSARPTASAPPGNGGKPVPTPSTTAATPPPEPVPPGSPCEGVGIDLGGHGGEGIPTLSWAPLKTGFRFIVAWTSPTATAATLQWSTGSGAPKTASSPSGTSHVFILEGLPKGEILCFQAQEASGRTSALHASRLANAMTAFDEASGSYRINLLAVAKFAPDRADVAAGLPIFARTVHDMTDGSVSIGEVIMLYAEADASYVIVRGATLNPNNVVHDIIFQFDDPLAAGYTWRDAIQEARDFIIMNQVTQAGPTPFWGATEVGKVLAHELGHYAFGALDLYTDLDDCVDAGKDLSVMGSDRGPDELDDEVNRCPNEDSIDGYVPSWTLLRDRYPNVPDRAGEIDPGPEDAGAAFHVLVIDQTV